MNQSHPAELDRPFPAIAVWQRYLGIGPIEEARQKLSRMINRGESLGVVMGPPGTGKTLLCHKLASLFRQSHEIVVLGDIRVTSRMGLIQQVLFHLGQPHHGQDEDSLHLALAHTLTKASGSLRSLLLIIDEAQMLSHDLLDEVRMLTNLVRAGRPVVQTLLVGGPQLEESLAAPQAESLVQRIAVRCYLHPLNHGETAEYIRTALGQLPIDDQAIASVHRASGGIPRLINQLMDRAIEVAQQRRPQSVTDACVQLAWAELQQLPSPVLEAEIRQQTHAIEFAELDGEAFDFENESTPWEDHHAAPTASQDDFLDCAPAGEYADIAAILNSASIDCLPPEAFPTEAFPAAMMPTEAVPTEVRLQTTYTSIPPKATPVASASPDELFGDDFDSEATLPLAGRVGAGSQPDPAAEELRLLGEIQRLSQAAQTAMYGEPAHQPYDQDDFRQTSAKPASIPFYTAQPGRSGGAPVWEPESTEGSYDDSTTTDDSGYDVADELAAPFAAARPSASSASTISASTNPLAAAWQAGDWDVPSDDRDLLVVEEEVSLLIDPPSGLGSPSRAPQPAAQRIVQSYQDLFSRLRGQQ